MTFCYPPSTDWSCDLTFYETLGPEIVVRSEALAWSTLQQLTAFQIGVCPVTIRPCRKNCLPGTWYESWVGAAGSGQFVPAINLQGQWVNLCMCGQDQCGCTRIREVRLPGPVGEVIEVQIDGVILDPTAYRIDNGDRLVRTDGDDWPHCQDMNLPDGEEGTFSVTYYQGASPDIMTNYAAGILAAEFARACAGGKCRLPSGVTSITRQGVTMEIQSGLFPNGFTGIREVDAVIGLYNPYALKSAPRIASPDYRPGRQSTWRV